VNDRVIAGRFQIDEAIGRGGMGTVWRARDNVLGRMVALKEVQIPTNLTPEGRSEVRQRVIREARAAAKMSHPSAVTVFDVIEEDNHIYIAMELVSSPTLSHLVETEGPFPPELAAKAGLAVLDALEVAHASGIVHRDVKPANIMVGEDRIKLADFGVASIKGDPRLTATGMVIGSPSYMSPEQASGEAADPATDYWGLGATLFFATEGHGPFDRPGPMPTLMAITNEDPPVAEHAGPLKQVISSLLSKDPAGRPSGAELRPILESVAGNGSVPGAGTPEHDTLETVPAVAAGLPATLLDSPAEQPHKAGRRYVGPDSDDEAGAAPPVVPAAAVPPARNAVEPRVAQPSAPHPVVPPDRVGSGNGWAIGATIAVLLVLAFLLVPRLLDNEDPGGNPGTLAQSPGETRPANPPAPAAAPTAAEEPRPAPRETTEQEQPREPSAEAGSLPDGWESSSLGDTGYTIGHPAGWSVVQNPLGDSSSMRFQTSRSRYLLVDWTDQPRDDAVAAWEQQAPAFAARHQGYEQIRIEQTEFGDFETAAIWEWTYTSGGVKLHAANLGFADDRWGFALNFQTRESDWKDSQDLFEQFQESFGAVG
jgi:hypothetical protein